MCIVSPKRNTVTVIKNYRIVTRKTYIYLKSNNAPQKNPPYKHADEVITDIFRPFDKLTYRNARSTLDQSHKLGQVYFKIRRRYMPTVVASFDR
jgi:hypothetical protein